MSKRSERREAERAARKTAYQQLREKSSATAPVAEPPLQLPAETDLLARAHAFFERPETAVSAAQMDANRANAKLSTGPVTTQGKAVSSRNNTRHGLSADIEGDAFCVLPTESQAAYDNSLAAFRAEWKPLTATEHDLVHRMATHQWLRRRALRLQESLFHASTGELTDIKRFELYRRYETSHERGFNKASADIQRLRSFQLRQQNGFESQQRKNEEHELKIARLKRDDDARIHKLTTAKPASMPLTRSTHAELPQKNAA